MKMKVPDRPTVLIVEDDPVLRRLVAAAFEIAGFCVHQAATVAESLEILESSTLSAVVADFHLGSETAWPVLQTCQKIDKDLPVVVVSGVTGADIRPEVFDLGVVSFFAKPFSPDLLVKHVRNLIGMRSRFADALTPQVISEILDLETVKKRYVTLVVELLGGNVSEAAKRLGVHRQTIAKLVEAHEDGILEPPGAKTEDIP